MSEEDDFLGELISKMDSEEKTLEPAASPAPPKDAEKTPKKEPVVKPNVPEKTADAPAKSGAEVRKKDAKPEKTKTKKKGPAKPAPPESGTPAAAANRPIGSFENRVNYIIIASSIGLLLIFVQYLVYEKVWLNSFELFNLFPTIVLGVFIAAALLIMLLPGVKNPRFTPRSMALYGGLVLVLISPVLVLLQNTRAVGFTIGLLGLAGVLIMLVGRNELRGKDIFLFLVFIVGAMLMLMSSVFGAFRLFSLPFSLNLSLVGGGFLLVLASTAFMGKLMRIDGKLVSYFGVWTVGILAIALVPFHEAVGLNASKNYGPYDQSLIFGGLLCVGLSLFLAVYRRYDVAKVTGYIVRGNMLQENGNYQGAIDFYDRAMRSGTYNEIVLTNKGSALRRMKRYDDALACFAEALELNPHYDEALVGKGNVLTKAGKFDVALQCYDAALTINRNHTEALVDRGILLSLMDRDAEADESLNRALKANPRSEYVYLGKAFLARKRGNSSDEIKMYDRALEINKSSADGLIGRGNALTALGRYDDAIESYDLVLDIEPKNADAWSNKGAVMLRQERFQDAADCYRQALEIRKDSVAALSGMGYAMFKLGSGKDGLEHLNRALDLMPDSIEALVLKADILRETGNHSDAVVLYRKALEINPSLKSVMKSLADSLRDSGSSADAQSYYDKIAAMERARMPTLEQARPAIDVRRIMQEMKTEIAAVPAAAPSATQFAAAPAPAIAEKMAAPAAAQAAAVPAAPAEKKPTEKKLKLDRGFNYLVFEVRAKKIFDAISQMLSEGVKVLCLTPTFPAKLKKEHAISGAEMVWISESSEKEAVNPKRLDFEIARAIGNFIRGNVDPVIVIDGFEFLMMQNGYENVMKFIKKANDLASVNGATIIVSLNPSAMKKEDLPLLQKEFDKVEDLIEV